MFRSLPSLSRFYYYFEWFYMPQYLLIFLKWFGFLFRISISSWSYVLLMNSIYLYWLHIVSPWILISTNYISWFIISNQMHSQTLWMQCTKTTNPSIFSLVCLPWTNPPLSRKHVFKNTTVDVEAYSVLVLSVPDDPELRLQWS